MKVFFMCVEAATGPAVWVEPVDVSPVEAPPEQGSSMSRTLRRGWSYCNDAAGRVYHAAARALASLTPRPLGNKVYDGSVWALKNIALLTFDPAFHRGLYWDRLATFSSGEQLPAACQAVSHFVTDNLLHSFRYPPHLNPNNPHWTAGLFRGGDGHLTWLGQRISELADRQEELLQQALETSLLKGMSNIAYRVYSVTEDRGSLEHDPNYLLHLTTKTLHRTVEHLKRVNEALCQFGPDVDSHIFRADLGEMLHSGLSVDPRMTEAERRQYTVQHYCERLSAELLKIAFPNGSNDLVVPFYLKERLWEALQEVIIPNVTYDTGATVVDHHLINTILLKALKSIDKPKTVTTAPKGYDPPNDRMQRELEQGCTGLVQQLLRLFAPSVASVVTRIPYLSESISSAIAGAIRERVDEGWTLLETINSGITSGLPLWHFGHWRNVDGKQVFSPVLLDEQEDGTNQLRSQYQFTFPRSEAEQRWLQEEQEVVEEATAQELLVELDRVLNCTIKTAIPNGLKTILKWLKDLPNGLIEGYVGQPGLTLKMKMERLLYLIFGVVIGTAIKVVLYPVTRLAGILIDQYTKSESEWIVQRLHMDIHQNLAYHFVDDIFSSLTKAAR